MVSVELLRSERAIRRRNEAARGALSYSFKATVTLQFMTSATPVYPPPQLGRFFTCTREATFQLELKPPSFCTGLLLFIFGCSKTGNICSPNSFATIMCRLKNPWPESVSELCRPNDRRLSAELVPALAETACHVVSVTDPYGRILDFLLFLPSRSSIVLKRLSGPRSRPTTSQKIW
jgi:hypothetical protein